MKRESLKILISYLHIVMWIFLMAVVIVLFGLFTKFDVNSDPNAAIAVRDPWYIGDNYPMF